MDSLGNKGLAAYLIATDIGLLAPVDVAFVPHTMTRAHVGVATGDEVMALESELLRRGMEPSKEEEPEAAAKPKRRAKKA